MPITNRQKSMIHVAKAQLQMEESAYRALLQRAAGVSKSTQLDASGFDAVMAEFGRLGFQIKRTRIGRIGSSHRPDMATPAQLGKIRALWADYTGRDDDLALGRWLEVHFHVSHVRFLGDVAAGKCIGVLTKMLKHKTTNQRASAAS